MTRAPEILVSPELLNAKADSVTGNIRKMEMILNQLGDVVRQTGNYWLGEAGEQCRRMYSEQEETRKQLLKDRLGKRPDELRETAGIFMKAVTEAGKNVAQLPDDLCS